MSGGRTKSWLTPDTTNTWSDPLFGPAAARGFYLPAGLDPRDAIDRILMFR